MRAEGDEVGGWYLMIAVVSKEQGYEVAMGQVGSMRVSWKLV